MVWAHLEYLLSVLEPYVWPVTWFTRIRFALFAFALFGAFGLFGVFTLFTVLALFTSLVGFSLLPFFIFFTLLAAELLFHLFQPFLVVLRPFCVEHLSVLQQMCPIAYHFLSYIRMNPQNEVHNLKVQS